MSDFATNENAHWQREVREKIERLGDSLNDRWCRWDDWERRFISSMVAKLEHRVINVSPKEYTKVWNLWERSFK